MEDDGFTLVSRKKSAKNKKKFKNKAILNQSISVVEGNFDTSLRKILRCKDEFSNNEQINDFVIHVRECISSVNCNRNDNAPLSITCYGLGQISFCKIAQNQFSFLLLLKEYLSCNVEAFDPIFSCVDKELLNFFSVQVLEHNEKAMRKISDGISIFYMPHCDLFLYNNLLWANWTRESLPRIIVIGNSFSTVIQSSASKYINKKYKYICMAEKLGTEYSFPTLQNHLNVFNSISAISFLESSNLSANENVWNYNDLPVYSDDEELMALVPSS